MVLSSFISPLGCNSDLSLQSSSFQKPQKMGRTFVAVLRSCSHFYQLRARCDTVPMGPRWGRVRWDVICVQRR